MEIRLMQPEEFAEVSAIANSSKYTKDLPYVTVKWQGERNIRVMLDGCEIVAYAYYVVTKYRDYVNLYWLGTKYSGKGYGKRFIKHITAEAKQAEKQYLIFKVNKANEAKLFYDNLGFSPSGENLKEYLYKIDLCVE